MFFQMSEGAKDAGWSESYVDSGDAISTVANKWFGSSSGVGQLIHAAPNPIGLLRVLCLGQGVLNTYNRLTLLQSGRPPVGPQRRNVFGVTGLVPGANLNAPYNPAFAGFSTDYAQTRLNFRMESDPAATPQYVRNAWLGGLPDVNTDTQSLRLLPGPINNAIIAFFNALVANCQLGVIDHSNGNPNVAISAFGPPNTFTTLLPHGFLMGNTLIATGWKATGSSPTLKGRYVVTSVPNANSFTIAIATSAFTPSLPFGYFRAVNYTFPPVFLIQNRGVTKRNAGRPFGLAVGRARKILHARA